MPRTITGLDVQENLSCEVLDIAQKVTILGETPTTKKFLAYNPPDDTTTYQYIDWHRLLAHSSQANSQ